jgi:hypothetical protein
MKRTMTDLRPWRWVLNLGERGISNFVVSLTVHFSIILANDQLDAQMFNTFITILYMYMFRKISCSSSGGQIVLIQHLVLSLSVSDRPVHRCTGQSLTDSDSTRCCINTI